MGLLAGNTTFVTNIINLRMGRKTDIVCLLLTIITTITTTVIFTIAVMSEAWEKVYFSKEILNKTLAQNPDSGLYMSIADVNGTEVLVIGLYPGETAPPRGGNGDFAGLPHEVTDSNPGKIVELFFPMHAGLWSICLGMSDEEYAVMFNSELNFTVSQCHEQLDEQDQTLLLTGPIKKSTRLIRLQKLTISCSMVCLIILFACLVIVWLGILQKQVPPIFVSSVLYILAAIFAIFALEIAHYKRSSSLQIQGIPCPSTIDTLDPDDPLMKTNELASYFLKARVLEADWAIYLGWLSVFLCLASSLCVYGLSKLMRNVPLILGVL